MSVNLKQMKMTAHCFVQWLLQEGFQSTKLLTVDEVPEIHREPYIYTGYRPVYKPWKYYVHSIFHLHNETMNIWTHLVGFVVISVYLAHCLSGYDVANDQIAWPILVFGVCCLLSMLLSSIAHLLHSKSPCHHYILFMLDYCAIAVYGFGIGMASMYLSSSKRFRNTFHPWHIPANVICSWFTFYTFCLARTKLSPSDPKRQQVMLLASSCQGLFLVLPVIPRYTDCLSCNTCEISSLNHVTIALLLDIIMGASYATLLPERLLPGRFDIFGHSHQIFHVLAIASMIWKLIAVQIDIETLDVSREVFPNVSSICVSFFVLVLLDVITYAYFVNNLTHPTSRRKSKKGVK